MGDALVRETTFLVLDPFHDDLEGAAVVVAALLGAVVGVSDVLQLRKRKHAHKHRHNTQEKQSRTR